MDHKNSRSDLIEAFQTSFASFKKSTSLKSTLEELDKAFFVEDAILSAGFISSSIGRQISHRIIDVYIGLNNYLHTLVMPDTHSLIQMNESKILTPAEKNEILKLISEAMVILSRNLIISLENNPMIDKEFIDQSLSFWQKTYRPRIYQIAEKIRVGWNK